MHDEKTDQEREIWSAIRYLDPDEKEKSRAGNVAAVIALLALLFVVCGLWFVLWLKGRGL
jgi:hypothetical protein